MKSHMNEKSFRFFIYFPLVDSTHSQTLESGDRRDLKNVENLWLKIVVCISMQIIKVVENKFI